MFEAFVNGDAIVDVYRQHAVDEIQSGVADAVPVRGGVVEAAHFDLLGEVVGVLIGPELVGEGGKAAKADVEDDAEGPDVDGAGVFSVFAVLQDFGGDVGGGPASDFCGEERLVDC